MNKEFTMIIAFLTGVVIFLTAELHMTRHTLKTRDETITFQASVIEFLEQANQERQITIDKLRAEKGGIKWNQMITE